MKMDGKEMARANLAKRAENKKIGDEAPEEVEGEIEDQGEHVKAMGSMIEAIHNKDPVMAHDMMVKYAQAYAKMKSE